jgi:hypothetical protein
VRIPNPSSYTLWGIPTLSPSPARQKFLNWHGVPEARVCRNQSVHGERKHKTLLIKILSPLLFSAPDVHLHTLEKMWVDGIMHGPVWQDTIKKLNDEWTEFILYVSRLLSCCIVAGDKVLIQSTCVCVGYSVAQRQRSISIYSEYRHSAGPSRLSKSSSSWLLSVYCG